MRFMMMVKSDYSGQPSPELMAAMAELIAREFASGRLIDTGGLLPPSEGFQVRLKGGRVKVTDGPFAEAREVVGGYAIFEFADREEALASAVEFVELHKRFDENWEGVCEARPIAPNE